MMFHLNNNFNDKENLRNDLVE